MSAQGVQGAGTRGVAGDHTAAGAACKGTGAATCRAAVVVLLLDQGYLHALQPLTAALRAQLPEEVGVPWAGEAAV